MEHDRENSRTWNTIATRAHDHPSPFRPRSRQSPHAASRPRPVSLTSLSLDGDPTTTTIERIVDLARLFERTHSTELELEFE